MLEWIISEFSAERAFGRVREVASGREVTFSIEAWSPCDPATARVLDDSDQRRSLLLPRIGEPVQVTWKKLGSRDAVAKVARIEPIDVLPPLAFRDWLAAMAAYISPISGWTEEEWLELSDVLAADLMELTDDPTPVDPTRHLGLLAWCREHAHDHPTVLRRLAWIADDSPNAFEGLAGARVGIGLSDAVCAALVAAALVVRSA